MSKLKVYKLDGSEAGDYDLSENLLELTKGSQAVHDSVVAAQNAQRAGTASTLSKGEVRGSGAKPWRQKGTGRARAGYRQSPVWRGGAVAFGPRPRQFTAKVNKKVARLAFRRALSEKVSAGAVRVVESVEMAEPRTRLMAQLLKTLGVTGPALILDATVDRNAGLAARNIAGLAMLRAADVNTLTLLRHPAVIVTRAGMEVLKSRLGSTEEVAA